MDLHKLPGYSAVMHILVRLRFEHLELNVWQANFRPPACLSRSSSRVNPLMIYSRSRSVAQMRNWVPR